jgi:hypothetical protein
MNQVLKFLYSSEQCYQALQMFLNIIHRRVFLFQNTTFRRLDVVFWKINRTVFLDENRTMDNVQKHNICTNLPSSQTFSSYLSSHNYSLFHFVRSYCASWQRELVTKRLLTFKTELDAGFLRFFRPAISSVSSALHNYGSFVITLTSLILHREVRIILLVRHEHV